MTRKKRIWIGITLLTVIVLNYLILGIPLIRRNASLQVETRAILLKQAKSGNLFRGSEDDYIFEIFRKEKASIDRKILILNCVAISCAVIVMSWAAFGLALRRK